jgi:ParB family transcriptional regulator, chromosome partitioning protein
MGRRVNLAALASEPVLEAPVPRFGASVPAAPALPPTTVPLDQVATNPVNPREDFGDLRDLESMRTVGQLQPCAVVRRDAFLAVYPEHGPAIGTADYVVVAGSRRRAAAEQFELETLDIVVRDQLAASRAQFYAASVAENIDRKNFDVLEEARAVQRLVQESSGQEAAEILGKSKGWVSQRLSLLKLSREMQDLLRAGDLPVRDARRLAGLPADRQLESWRQEQETAAEQAARDLVAAEPERFTAVNPSGDGARAEVVDSPVSGAESSSGDPRQPRLAKVSFSHDATPQEIAAILRGHLSPEGLEDLVGLLAGLPR